MAPQTGEFLIRPNTWTRFWMFVDFANNQLSYWIGDSTRSPTQIFDSIAFHWKKTYGEMFGFDQFWFEFNTSQSRSGPKAFIWGRNLVILHNISSVKKLIGGEASESPTPPMAPQSPKGLIVK